MSDLLLANPEPSFTVESRVSLAQAAKENTEQIIQIKEQKKVKNGDASVNTGVRDSVDYFNSGKFTFEPSSRLQGNKEKEKDINEGMSFGGNELRIGRDSAAVSFSSVANRQSNNNLQQ